MKMSKTDFVILGHIHLLCTSIKNYFNISYEEARKMLYNSKLYNALENEETKMWYYSNYDLFKMFLEEKETGKYTVYGGQDGKENK